MTSSTLLAAHGKLYEGIDLPSVCGKDKGIKKNNDAYVDDVDTWAGSLSNGRDAADEVMFHLMDGAQKWSDVQDVVAASTAFHKCMVQILSHVAVNGSMVIDYEYRSDVTLSDIKGAATTIKFLTPREPNEGLGFNIAPDGNQRHEFKKRLGKIKHMCMAAVSIFLSQREAYKMLQCRLIPQTAYGMRLSQFTQRQCHQLDVRVLQTFLPLLTVNRSMPRAVVHVPIQYGGMNLLKHSSLQDQWGLHYFIQCLRWDDITAGDIITALDAFQLVSGFVTPVLSSPTIPISYAGQGLIPHIRDRLRALDGQIEVEKAWRPHLQRINDDSIMENIAASKNVTALEIKRAGEV